jgi:RNA polymerase sigma-70 factor (ECF subfamily)
MRDDSELFSRMFEMHRVALRRYAEQFVKSREIAEDVVQDVFIGVWNRWSAIDLTGNLRAYLFQATRNRALNHIRDQRVQDRRALLYEGPSLVQPPAAEAAVRSEEITRAIEHVLRLMPPRRREVVSLRLRDHLSHAEIASKLGISQKGVEAHITRAVRTLREKLPTLLGERGGDNG